MFIISSSVSVKMDKYCSGILE